MNRIEIKITIVEDGSQKEASKITDPGLLRSAYDKRAYILTEFIHAWKKIEK